MITEQITNLNNVRVKFQPYIDNSDLVYTYIAPKDKTLYARFLNLVVNFPDASSIYEVLSDETIIEELLEDEFDEKTELEIYVGTDDTSTQIFINGTLKEYIKRETITFEY